MFSGRENDIEQTNSSAYLEYLLDMIVAKPETKEEITQKIEDVFGQDKAVMLLDMSGFCTKTSKHGIVQVLSIIYRMRNLLKPVIESENGKLIKTEADSLFCLFDNVADAVRVSRRINEYLAETNKETDEDCQINVSVGIGYGHILNIADSDLFGEEVNLASKLGEDIASKGEILLTENALNQLLDADCFVVERTISISGISLNYHAIK
jgi:adenylate cyclase